MGMATDWKTIGQHVRTRRKARKLTQQQLAARIDKTHQMVSALEKGQTGASLETLEAVAEALGGELVLDFKFAGEPRDPVADQIRAAIPRLPPRALRALLAQVEAFDALLESDE